MGNRISITLGGKTYKLVAEDNAEYMEELARQVDGKIVTYKREMHFSDLDAALLTALELADECRKATERAENARNQIQNCLEDASKARAEAAELKRELAKLNKK